MWYRIISSESASWAFFVFRGGVGGWETILCVPPELREPRHWYTENYSASSLQEYLKAGWQVVAAGVALNSVAEKSGAFRFEFA